MKRTSLKFGLLAAVVLTVSLLATNSNVIGKGKPPKDDPPLLSIVRYDTDLIPTPAGVGPVYPVEINNLGMAVGHYTDEGGNPFLYAQPTGAFYDFRAINSLVQQVDQLVPGWRFSQAQGINDLGEVVGSLFDPASGDYQGYMIDTSLSADPDDWIVLLLPNLGSNRSRGIDINIHGDALGIYERPDGTQDLFLYNPSSPPSPDNPLALNLVNTLSGVLNNNGQVAGVLDNGSAFLFDPNTQPPTLDEFDIASGSSSANAFVGGLNDAGILAGVVQNTRINGKGKSYDVLFRSTSQLDDVVKESPYTLFVSSKQTINSTDDLAYYSDDGVFLVHTGFSPDFTEQVWNLGDLISQSDPLRDALLENFTSANGMSDRSDVNDATGYPQFVVRLWMPQPDGSTSTVAVVLTPYIPAP